MTKITSPWARSLRLWFLTNVIGMVLIAFYCLAASAGKASFGGSFLILLIGVLAALFSLPTIPLGVAVFNTILSVPSQQRRLVFAFLVVSGLWLVTLLIATICLSYAGEFTHLADFGSPYFLSALVAAGLVYRPWLFGTNG